MHVSCQVKWLYLSNFPNSIVFWNFFIEFPVPVHWIFSFCARFWLLVKQWFSANIHSIPHQFHCAHRKLLSCAMVFGRSCVPNEWGSPLLKLQSSILRWKSDWILEALTKPSLTRRESLPINLIRARCLTCW